MEIKEGRKVQHTTGEVQFVAITTKTETELTESCDTEDEEHDSERKQKVKKRESIDKGKILSGKREPFDIEGRKQERRVEKKEGGKEEEKKHLNYQMMKTKKYQNENNGGRLNEKGKKEKGKYEISRQKKHDKTKREEKVTKKENYTESNLEMKYIALEPEKKGITQQTENQKQNWDENKKDLSNVEITDKREKEYVIRALNIEKKVKDNLQQNEKKKNVEK